MDSRSDRRAVQPAGARSRGAGPAGGQLGTAAVQRLTGIAAEPARPEAGTSNPRFLLFDSLRAIAALCVFTIHLPWIAHLAPDSEARIYLQQLNVGVAVFFLISGFLLYRPFARARYAGEKSPGIAAYAERRALRIFPAYWAALVGVVILVGASGEAATATRVFSIHGALAYFPLLQGYDSNTLLGGISAAWTLSVELSFYALLPLWALLLRRWHVTSRRDFLRSEFVGLAVLFAVGITWTAVAAAGTHPTTAVFLDVTLIKPWLYVLPGFLDQFAVGMALAVVSVALANRPGPEPGPVRLVDRAPWAPWLMAAVAFYLIAHLVRWIPGNLGLQTLLTHELQWVVGLGLLLPAVFGAPGRGWVRKLLANRVLLWVGLVSYGVYLWHVAIQSKLADLGLLDSLGNGPFTMLALAVTLATAAASFYGIERHALRLGRRLSRRRRSQDADMRMRDLPSHERSEPGAP